MRAQYPLRAQRLLCKTRPPVTSTAIRTYASTAKNHPVDNVVDSQLDNTLTATQPATQEAPTSASSAQPKIQREETIARAQIVFGSKLQGPQRRAQVDARSRLVAGILVPPKPEEPDNCCMSGCVNCVWDLYRDEMEEWAAKSAEVRAVLAKQKAAAPTPAPSIADIAPTAAMSMDDDGGGSESNWNDEGSISGDMFEGVPVGIRAFMETEKRLKKRHLQEPAANA